MKKTNKLKLVPMIVVGLIVAGVVSAAVIYTYVSVSSSTTVGQAVESTHNDTIINTDDIDEDRTYESTFDVTNNSSIAIPVNLVTTYKEDTTPITEGITTSYWNTLELTEKDSEWKPTPEIEGTLTYELIANEFNYEFYAEGLKSTTKYSLIYYADKPNRMVNWGGGNPGAYIVEFTSDSDGRIRNLDSEFLPIKGSVDLNMNLPSSPDWNATIEADYSIGPDNYLMHRGAKIWLVETNVLNVNYPTPDTWIEWGTIRDEVLFETDLITYSDSSIGDVSNDILYLYTGTLNITVRNKFADNISGTYEITTNVVPAGDNIIPNN